MSKFEWIIVHCTATTAEMNEVDAAWVDRLHKERGWVGCGYHEVITRGGQRQNRLGGYPTRRLDQSGAHVGDCGPGWNSKALGISLAGGVSETNQPEDNFTEPQYESLFAAVREYQRMFNILDERVIGHRDLIKMTGAPPKACPCFSVQAWITGKQRFGGNFARQTDPAEGPLAIPETYTVQPGDTAWRIARAYGLQFDRLHFLNQPTDLARIEPGQVLRLR